MALLIYRLRPQFHKESRRLDFLELCLWHPVLDETEAMLRRYWFEHGLSFLTKRFLLRWFFIFEFELHRPT